MPYNWQLKDWPHFTFERSALESKAVQYSSEVAYLIGRMSSLADEVRYDMIAENLATEAMYNSAIEGVRYSSEDLKSSILNGLYPEIRTRHVTDYRADNLGKLMIDSRRTYEEFLTEDRLFYWHKLLLGHRKDIKEKGEWRVGEAPMQIVSGAYGKEKIHFEAPPSKRVPSEMSQFINWFNDSKDQFVSPSFYAPIKAGLSHVYFESIHPFEDGNGRIGRVIAEKALAQPLGHALPFSLSYAIIQKQNKYYDALQECNRKLDVTNWLTYFLDTCLLGLDLGRKTLDLTVSKAKFYQRFSDKLDAKHSKAIRKMFEAGPKGFEGGMTNKKYVRINRVSHPTAARDLTYLTIIGALERRGAGRSTHYVLVDMS